MDAVQKNVFGEPIKECSCQPMTGYFRDGSCNTNDTDLGSHTVCVLLTDEFLSFTLTKGNDLVTPMPEYNFPGLKAGDRWCLCAMRWKEAFDKGVAPKVVLEATNEKILEMIELDELKSHAIDIV